MGALEEETAGEKREIYVPRTCMQLWRHDQGFSKKWYVDLHTGLIFDLMDAPAQTDSSDKFAKDATTTANATDQKSSKDEGARGKSFSPYRLLRSATDRVLGSPNFGRIHASHRDNSRFI